MTSEKFCLRWNDFESNISSAFRDIRDEKEFFDITIACEDEQLQAHKVILSACSPFFKNVLRRYQHQHPLLYLKGVSLRDMESVLNFMYHGEVNVAQEDLNSFLQVAEDLRVKGLTQNSASSLQTEAKTNTYVPKPEARRNPQQTKFVASPIATKQPHPTPPTHLSQPNEDIEHHVSVVKSEPRDQLHSMENNPIQPIMEEQNIDIQTNMMEHYDDHYEEEDYEGQFEDNLGFETSMVVMGGQDSSGAGPKDSCPICHKEMLKTNIPKHMKKKHAPDDPAECPFCFKVFKTSYNMKDHVRYMHK